MELFNKKEATEEVVEATEVVEVKKGFHPVQKIKGVIDAHPKAARVVAGVAIGLAAAGATLAAIGKRNNDEDSDGEIEWIDLDEVASNDEASEETEATE